MCNVAVAPRQTKRMRLLAQERLDTLVTIDFAQPELFAYLPWKGSTVLVEVQLQCSKRLQAIRLEEKESRLAFLRSAKQCLHPTAFEAFVAMLREFTLDGTLSTSSVIAGSRQLFKGTAVEQDFEKFVPLM